MLTIKRPLMGSTYQVNRADAVCGNVQTANAPVHSCVTECSPSRYRRRPG